MTNPTPEDKMRAAAFPVYLHGDKDTQVIILDRALEILREAHPQYQSAVSGLWYDVPDAAGTISAVRVNGRTYKLTENLEGSWPWALSMMKAGKRVQRCKWNGLYIRIADGKVWRPSGDTERPATVLHTAGLLADDWRIVPEEE